VIRATRVSFTPAIRSIRVGDLRDPRLVILLIRAICVSSHE
jgi:hypothetical protein